MRKVNLFIKNPNLTKKKNSGRWEGGGGGGGGGGVARVSDFSLFFPKDPSWKFLFFFLRGRS